MRRLQTELDVQRIRNQRRYAQCMLWTFAGALWLLLIFAVGGHLHLPFGQAVVVLVLVGITIALRRVLTRYYHVWAVSAFLAPIIIMLGLFLIELFVTGVSS